MGINPLIEIPLSEGRSAGALMSSDSGSLTMHYGRGADYTIAPDGEVSTKGKPLCNPKALYQDALKALNDKDFTDYQTEQNGITSQQIERFKGVIQQKLDSSAPTKDPACVVS